MTWLSNDTVARLREITETPDFSGTRYRLVRELGRGGMGVVYEVEDVELDRHVALKVTNVLLRDTDELRSEARTIARLEHPGIVPVHDTGALADGRVYYAMKLVRGVRLDEWSRGAHPRTERLRLFARICEPVAFAHLNGVVHRDLKPENVMVGELGAVLVMDWGVAGVGTPGYMAPEQRHGPATAASDVFALGRLLEFLIAREEKPRRLQAILDCATAEDPDSRYRDARALATDVLSFLDGEPVRAYHEGFLGRAERFVSRNRVVLTLIAAYVVMRVIVFFWMRL